MPASPVQALGVPPPSAPTFGAHLRRWRTQRRLTQLDLAAQAAMSPRHLSCVETGRAEPSRELVLRLAQCLDVPIRARNAWLVAAGFAPMYRERALDHADMAVAHQAVQRLLTCHEPFPAIAMDHHWNIVASNRATAVVLAGAHASRVALGANVIRLCHGPDGLSHMIANLAQLRQYQTHRLQQQIGATADPVLVGLLAELRDYPTATAAPPGPLVGASIGVAAPLQIHSAEGMLSFFTASTVFGSANDITMSEMAMELFLPADEWTAAAVPRLMADTLRADRA